MRDERGVSHLGVIAFGIELSVQLMQLSPQQPGGVKGRRGGVVVKVPDLVATAHRFIRPEFITQLRPHKRRSKKAVHHDKRLLIRIVRLHQREPWWPTRRAGEKIEQLRLLQLPRAS